MTSQWWVLFRSLIINLRVMNWKYLRHCDVVVRASDCIFDGVRSEYVLAIPFLNFKEETSLVLIGFLLCVPFNRIGWPSRSCTDLCLQSTTMLALQMESCLTRVATLPSARFGDWAFTFLIGLKKLMLSGDDLFSFHNFSKHMHVQWSGFLKEPLPGKPLRCYLC